MEILKQYAGRDNRIKVFHKENGGASSARNFGIGKIENEEWLSFVDADDFVSPYFYEAIINAINSQDEVEYVRLYCQTTMKRYNTLKEEGWSNLTNSNCDTEIVDKSNYFTLGVPGGFTQSLFIKSSVVKQNALQFPEDMRILEDQVFSLTCASYCNKFLLLKSPRNYFYFNGNEQSITKTSSTSMEDTIRCINRTFAAFSRDGLTEILQNYYYRQYLPSQLDSLYGSIIKQMGKDLPERIDPNIQIPLKHMKPKTLLKYMIARTFKLI